MIHKLVSNLLQVHIVLVPHEALHRKTAAAVSSALSMAEYIFNKPELSDKSRDILHHIKLDMVAAFSLSWRAVHYNMLMRHSIALDNLSNTFPPVYEDHASFKDMTLFRGELAKLQKANTECANTLIVSPTPAAPSTS